MDNRNKYLPLVSIALCSYNGSKYIRDQLDSLLSQTYDPIEIVIIDDASTDNTQSILKEYALNDNRIQLYFNENNLGYNKNFEKAFGLCNADYIAISDQDDIWHKDKISIMIANWPENADFVFSLSGSFKNSNFNSRDSAPDVQYNDMDDPFNLVFNSPVHGHACMFKKDLLNSCTAFPEKIFYDWWMSMHAVAKKKIYCIPQTLTWHRVHDTNSSRDIFFVQNILERNKLHREQAIYFLETFLQKGLLLNSDEMLLREYVNHLKKSNGVQFSKKFFFFIMKNRKRIFHYKKSKPTLFFSELKHAFRMAKTGVLS